MLCLQLQLLRSSVIPWPVLVQNIFICASNRTVSLPAAVCTSPAAEGKGAHVPAARGCPASPHGAIFTILETLFAMVFPLLRGGKVASEC